MNNDEFYHAVAGMLGTRYDYTRFTGHKRTRWKKILRHLGLMHPIINPRCRSGCLPV